MTKMPKCPGRVLSVWRVVATAWHCRRSWKILRETTRIGECLRCSPGAGCEIFRMHAPPSPVPWNTRTMEYASSPKGLLRENETQRTPAHDLPLLHRRADPGRA